MAVVLPPHVHLSNSPPARTGAGVVRGALSRGRPAVVIKDPGQPLRVVVVAHEQAERVVVAADRGRIAAAWTVGVDTHPYSGDYDDYYCCYRVRWSTWRAKAAPSAAQTISPAGENSDQVSAALGRGGRVQLLWVEGDPESYQYVAWTTNARVGEPGVQRIESDVSPEIEPVLVDLGGSRAAATWQTDRDTVVLDLPDGKPRTLPINTNGFAQIATTRGGTRLIVWQDARYHHPDLHLSRLPWRGHLDASRTVARKVDYYSWSFAYRPNSLLLSWTQHLPDKRGGVFVRRGPASGALGPAHQLAHADRFTDQTHASFTPLATVQWEQTKIYTRNRQWTARQIGTPRRWHITKSRFVTH